MGGPECSPLNLHIPNSRAAVGMTISQEGRAIEMRLLGEAQRLDPRLGREVGFSVLS